jgi:hypothetical protein
VTLARKLALLVAVPLVAVVAFAVLALYTTARQAVGSDNLEEQVQLAGIAGELQRKLHRERVAAVDILVPSPTGSQREQFEQSAKATDVTVTAYRRERAALVSLPGHLADVLGSVDRALGDLPGLREQC